MPTSSATLREEIVRTALKMLELGLVVGSVGNVSARDPSDSNTIYIKPSGLPYARLTPEDIMLIDLEGRVLQGRLKPSSEWRLHATIYRARPEVHAVVHTHSVEAQAWSFLGEELPARTEELEIFVEGSVRTAQYAPSGTQELADRALEALLGRKAVLLARHGVVGVGTSLEEALTICQIVERQAHVAWLLRLAGEKRAWEPFNR